MTPRVTWAFHSRQLESGFFFLGLVFIFLICLVVIGIALGVLKYLEKKQRMVKGHKQLVQALKVSPFLIIVIEYIVYVAEVRF